MRRAAFLLFLFACTCAHVPPILKASSQEPDQSAQLLAALLAAAPQPQQECVTACGLRAEYTSEERCSALRSFEKKTLAAYKKNVKWFGASNGCLALYGWQVKEHELTMADVAVCGNDAWRVDDLCMAGYTHIEERVMEIVKGLPWNESGLAHEFGHVMLGVGHCGWKERGANKAIEEVTGQKTDYKTGPNHDCD